MSFLGSFITLMAAGLWHWLLIAFAIGYLLGSIPFGLILTRLGGAGDVRAIGSGNIGATNVLRTGRKGLALATFAADALKGTAAVLIANHYFGQAPAAAAGIGAVLGHVHPVWLKFRGGKGVATYAGVIAGLAWPGLMVFAVAWLATAAVTKLSSLAALVAVVATPVALLFLGYPEIAFVATVLSLLIVSTHRGNIRRLLNGEEPKIGSSKTSTTVDV